jgi:hypothetical protein
LQLRFGVFWPYVYALCAITYCNDTH